MNRTLITALAMAGAMALAPTAAIAGPTFNGAPADGWFYGGGNDYSPANTAVLTTDDGDQLYLRMHKTGQVAPASDGNGVYSFALGTQPISFDWGIDSHTDSFDGVTALLTLTNLNSGATLSYDPFSTPDNEFADGSVQNSARVNWFLPFYANLNDTYSVNLNVTGFGQSPQSLTVYAKIGSGVPEPASWALMLGGFGLVGGAMRRHKTKVAFA